MPVANEPGKLRTWALPLTTSFGSPCHDRRATSSVAITLCCVCRGQLRCVEGVHGSVVNIFRMMSCWRRNPRQKNSM